MLISLDDQTYQLMELLEEHGPQTVRQLLERGAPNCDVQIQLNLRRCRFQGLAMAGKAGRASLYAAAPGWRDRIVKQAPGLHSIWKN